MAKKYAMGITHCLIDIPVGVTAKVKDMKTALELKKQFEYVGKRFGMKMRIEITEAKEPVGRGIGPVLQAREALRILEQHSLRSLDLENKALLLAASLVDLTGYAKGGKALQLVTEQLRLGKALKKMKEIIKAQNGKDNYKLTSDDLILGNASFEYLSKKDGMILDIDMKLLNNVARTLGCPLEDGAGIYLNKKLGDKVKKDELIFTLYSESKHRLKDALCIIGKNSGYKIG